MKKWVAFFSLLFALQAKAQIGALYTMDFLNLPASAKINAMGGKVVASDANELSFGLNNPALLKSTENHQLNLNHGILFGGIQFGTVGYANYNEKNDVTFSGAIQYIHYGILRRADENGVAAESFRCSEYALQGGFGKQFAKRFSAGANGKFILSTFDGAQAHAFALDLGAAYKDTAKKLMLSFLIKNAGIQTKSYAGRQVDEASNAEGLPIDVQFGLSKRLAHVPVSLSLVVHHLQKYDIRYDNPNDQLVTALVTNAADTSTSFFANKHIVDKIARHFILGGTFHLSKVLELHAGYNHLRRMELKTADRQGLIGFSMGFTITTQRFTLGYSRAYFYLPSANNMISFSTTFPSLKNKK